MEMKKLKHKAQRRMMNLTANGMINNNNYSRGTTADYTYNSINHKHIIKSKLTDKQSNNLDVKIPL